MYDSIRHRIQTLVPMAIGAKPDAPAAQALQEIDEQITVHGFAGLSHALRGAETGPGWGAIWPTEITPGLPQVALRFLTCHRDGRVREAAVRSLDESGAGLRWLLLRTNDWYEPLAELAALKVANRITAENAPHWLPLLGLVAGFGRGVAGQVVHSRIAQVGRDHPELLKNYITDPNAFPASRRLAWKMLNQNHPVLAFQSAASSADVVLRGWALQSSHDIAYLQKVFSEEWVPRLRREAFSRLWEAGVQNDEILARALLDKNPSMRETAKFYGKKSGQEELIRSIYRHAPLSAGKLEGAVGVLPGVELEPLLLESLHHPRRPIVRAAMQALDRHLREPEHCWWSMLRTDADPWKRRWAGQLLKKRRSFYFGGELIWQAYEEAESPIGEELLGWAQRSHDPYTKLRALYQLVLSQPESISYGEFKTRQRNIIRALPPYALAQEKWDKLQEMVSRWPEDWRA